MINDFAPGLEPNDLDIWSIAVPGERLFRCVAYAMEVEGSHASFLGAFGVPAADGTRTSSKLGS